MKNVFQEGSLTVLASWMIFFKWANITFSKETGGCFSSKHRKEDLQESKNKKMHVVCSCIWLLQQLANKFSYG